jgi:hypothetical protein
MSAGSRTGIGGGRGRLKFPQPTPRIVELPLGNPTLYRSQRVAYLAPQFLNLSPGARCARRKTLPCSLPSSSLLSTNDSCSASETRPLEILENNGVEPEVNSQK